MPVSEATFLQLAQEDPNRWELVCGQLREKPSMSADHNRTTFWLGVDLAQQIDRTKFDVRVTMGHVRHPSGSYYIPDVYVIPIELVNPQLGQPGVEVYEAPLPLVVEVWSPSTGGFDTETKVPEYQRRGDLEIWRIHPYERTLTAWRRQSDGSYTEAMYRGGVVEPVALPNVRVDLDALFA